MDRRPNARRKTALHRTIRPGIRRRPTTTGHVHARRGRRARRRRPTHGRSVRRALLGNPSDLAGLRRGIRGSNGPPARATARAAAHARGACSPRESPFVGSGTATVHPNLILIVQNAAAQEGDDRGGAKSRNSIGSGCPTVRHRSGGNVAHGRYVVCYRHELCSRPHPYRLSNERKLVDPNHVLLNKYPSISPLRRHPKAVLSRKSATEGSLEGGFGGLERGLGGGPSVW